MGMTTIIEDSIQRQYRARARDFWKQIAWHTVLIIITFFLLLPVIFVISTALKKAGTELTYPIEWIPDPIVWQNYITAMTLPGLPFPLFIKNTVIITVLIMSGDVITTSMAGFAFARLRFPLRDKIFILVVSTMMLPYAVTMLPTFLLFSELNMVDTFTPLDSTLVCHVSIQCFPISAIFSHHSL
jgi:ABC-type glycerol-3-phosphate transport system permease component